MKLLIKQGKIVDPVSGIGGKMDILIEDGRISCIGSQLEDRYAQVVDARGFAVCAGLVDMHVHLRDPGLTYKEDIVTGTAAAAHGGFTSIACMANTKPVADNPETIRYIREKAQQEGSGVQVWPVGAVTVGLQGEQHTDFKALKAAGAVALSDDGVPVMDANLMRDALIMAGRQKLPILCHEEDSTLADNYAVNEGRVSRQLGIHGRPAIAEEIMIMRDAMLAEETGQPVHICHISTAKSVEIVRRYKRRGVQITCETCPQYFTLTHEQVLLQGSMARVNPPLRPTKDVEAIVEGLRDGTIDCIVTDHAPHSAEEKAKPLPEAPSGMVGLETSLAIALTQLYHTGKMSLADVIRKMTINPARILRLRKGSRGMGADAALTIFDPNEAWTIDPGHFRSKGRNTPFAGMQVKGKVKYTIVGGNIIYRYDA
ncbi:MAG: dihydroorotase [Clostridiales bacterium]|nr:dihydroorotase [Clostridiales bacterium]